MSIDPTKQPITYRANALPNPSLPEHEGIWLIKRPIDSKFRIYIINESGNIVEINAITEQQLNSTDISELSDTTNLLFSKNYNDLFNKPAIPESTSGLINDSGFITINDIPSGGATEAINVSYDNTSGLGATNVQDAIDEVVDMISEAGGGTVTSVGLTVPTGLSVSGSPVTTSGTIDITYTSGYKGFRAELEDKLANIEEGAQVNVNADWNAVSGDAQILNKPSIPTKTSDLTNDSGFITDNDIPEHNDLTGLQGGTVTQRYHLNQTEHEFVQSISPYRNPPTRSIVVFDPVLAPAIVGIGTGPSQLVQRDPNRNIKIDVKPIDDEDLADFGTVKELTKHNIRVVDANNEIIETTTPHTLVLVSNLVSTTIRIEPATAANIGYSVKIKVSGMSSVLTPEGGSKIVDMDNVPQDDITLSGTVAEFISDGSNWQLVTELR